MSAVPAIQFTPIGIVVPTDAEILAGVQTDLNSAFGGNLNPALETPQGQMASSLTAITSDKDAQIAEIVNQINPDYADGRWQDAIGRIYFIDRIPASGTVVSCTVGGLAGTVIPVGAQAQDANGYIYICTSGVTIPVAGTATAQFTNQTYGAIACPAGTLTKIYQAISGWDTITNPTAGALGRLAETRQEFETRRQASVALNANGTVQAIRAAVYNLSGVLSVFAYDNPTGSTLVYGGYTLAAHSVYVAVEGGVDADIAQAIWSKKSGGCDYNGNTSVIVYDTNGYQVPYPQYNVTFNRPTSLPIYFNVQIRANSQLPTTINTLIQNAIINAFTGGDGGTAVEIGADIFASRFYSPVAATDPNIEILSIQIGLTSPGAANYLTINIDQYPIIDAAYITVTQV